MAVERLSAFVAHSIQKLQEKSEALTQKYLWNSMIQRGILIQRRDSSNRQTRNRGRCCLLTDVSP